ncbi:HAD family hydrolase [Bacillus suaedae]|uniref:HAD family hydrolase n=1 Tax=Halalkalibacter suaedae TaxID=2822140 RepID=A0A940WTH1_9BACI|nr:HAD family hydrolase [Bacillus suaedae]MBP3950137.1 HAD family hydrolase [Bacillus suaedae]
MLKDIKLVLFDLDNTLFDFETYWTIATKEYFYLSDITRNLPFEEFFSRFSYYDHYFWERHLLGEQSLDEVRQQRLMHTLIHFNIVINAEEADAYFKGFFNLLLSLIKRDEKVHSFLKDLKQSFKVGIVTNGKVDEQRAKLSRLGLFELFTEDEIFISEDMDVEKPHEDAFFSPLLKFNVSPTEVIYVGDSWSSDIVGAINAGIDAVWLNPKGLEPRGNLKPLLIKSSLMDLQDCDLFRMKVGV